MTISGSMVNQLQRLANMPPTIIIAGKTLHRYGIFTVGGYVQRKDDDTMRLHFEPVPGLFHEIALYMAEPA